jgi:hypothetical protein
MHPQENNVRGEHNIVKLGVINMDKLDQKKEISTYRCLTLEVNLKSSMS